MDDRGGAAAAEELVRASGTGDEAAVSRLLGRGVPADTRDAEGRTGLDLAVRGGRDGVVRLLLAAGADPEQTTGPYDEELPLVQAATGGRTGIVRQLLAAGADPDRANRLRATALGRAGAEGHTGTARVLLEHGADPHFRWKALTPAEWATRFGHTETADLLRI
ncbi:ankyrin repeat domain-containing protein [Streptomyces sp. NBC_01264]|uniref:ankyrin repeat domain-containing protein n=1 Tax=Streptomyces sp. NBC_01264 TaxID=2903804 RepID=UPI002251E73A|nr:ankyrin repeat domain-containing protein [Streptomyces sp. NBC_01264]MCX4778319.1 ankyrin repeat domain-containing protein [Streptomyces sp. NBC_01264]